MDAANRLARGRFSTWLNERIGRSLRHGRRPMAATCIDLLRLVFCLIAASGSAFLAYIIYYYSILDSISSGTILFFHLADDRYFHLALFAGLIFTNISYVFYRRSVQAEVIGLLREVCICWGLTFLTILTILFVMKTSDSYSRGLMGCWFAFGIAALFLARALEQWVRGQLADAGLAQRWIAIVGATPLAAQLAKRLAMPDLQRQIRLVGIFEERPGSTDAVDPHLPIAGDVEDLIRMAERGPLDSIVIALPSHETDEIGALSARLRALPIDILLGPSLAQLKLNAKPDYDLAPLPFSSLSQAPMRDWMAVAKWLEDKVIALAALIFTAPLLALIIVLIKLDSPGPALFRQKRLGFNNNEFMIYKFRTMYQDLGDQSGTVATQRDDHRVTRIGRFLRRTSLDELPQLINVLRGEMSIVGPRPHPVAMRLDNQLITERLKDYAARHRVKPGLTGLAQVNGNRGEIDSHEKAEQRIYYDLLYIDRWNIWLDLEIIMMTCFKVPFDRSAY